MTITTMESWTELRNFLRSIDKYHYLVTVMQAYHGNPPISMDGVRAFLAWKELQSSEENAA